MLCGALVWFLPKEIKGVRMRRREMVAAIEALQKTLCVIIGAFQTMTAAVVNAKTLSFLIE
jgi:hypothetical protein